MEKQGNDRKINKYSVGSAVPTLSRGWSWVRSPPEPHSKKSPKGDFFIIPLLTFQHYYAFIYTQNYGVRLQGKRTMPEPMMKYYITYIFRRYFGRDPNHPKTKEITEEMATNPEQLTHPAGIYSYKIWRRGEVEMTFHDKMTTFVTSEEVLHHS